MDPAAQQKRHARVAQALVMLHDNAAAHSVLGLYVSHVEGVMMCTAWIFRVYVKGMLRCSIYAWKMTHRHYIHLPAGKLSHTASDGNCVCTTILIHDDQPRTSPYLQKQ